MACDRMEFVCSRLLPWIWLTFFFAFLIFFNLYGGSIIVDRLIVKDGECTQGT